MELGFRHAEVRFFISNCVQEQVHKKQNLALSYSSIISHNITLFQLPNETLHLHIFPKQCSFKQNYLDTVFSKSNGYGLLDVALQLSLKFPVHTIVLLSKYNGLNLSMKSTSLFLFQISSEL